MEKYIKIIDEMAVEAAHLYCEHTICGVCMFGHMTNCFEKCTGNFKQGIITALAVEKVKEKANESKD